MSAINSGTISAVDGLTRQNRRITTRKITVELMIRKGPIQKTIHKNLGYGKICAVWLGKHLSDNKKQQEWVLA